MKEELFQWAGIGLTSLGLIISSIMSWKGVRAARIESELNSFSTMSSKYVELLDHIINNVETFQEEDASKLGPVKYKIYLLFELLSTVYLTQKYQEEVGKEFFTHWENRIKFLFSKPLIRNLWEKHSVDSRGLYDSSFLAYIDGVRE